MSTRFVTGMFLPLAGLNDCFPFSNLIITEEGREGEREKEARGMKEKRKQEEEERWMER